MAKNSPPVRLRRLGAQLRRLREEAGLTLDEAAELVRHSRSALARIENAQVVVRPHDVDYILIRYGVRDGELRDTLLNLAAAGRKKGWAKKHEDILSPSSIDYITLESDATSIRNFDALHLPGLLQTKEYARAIIAAFEPVQVERYVDIRMAMQAILGKPNSPRLVSVVTEATLRQQVGGADAMRAQLQYLLEVSQLEHVTIHVLPFAVGAHVGMDGPFTILEVADQLSVVLVEGIIRGSYLEEDEDIDRSNMLFDRLRDSALSENDSRSLIDRIANTF